MLLGDMIARMNDESVAMEMLMGLGDLSFLARVEDMAARENMRPGEFAVRAVVTFSHQASDGDWLSLLGAAGKADEPGGECLKRMVEFSLRPREANCNCGGADSR
jgi:hypothetical protein